MVEPIGRILAARRRELGMAQRVLAVQLGVSHRTLSRWEREAERVPSHCLEAMVDILQLDPAVLKIQDPSRIAGLSPSAPRPKGFGHRPRDLPPYPCKGTIEQLLSLGSVFDHLLARLEARGMDQRELARLEATFPHDSALELLAVLVLLAAGFTWERLAPLDLDVRLLILQDEHQQYAGHLRRDTLVLRGEHRTIVLFPQVWLPVLAQSRCYRVDFLIGYRYGGPLPGRVDGRRLQGRWPGAYLILELDGKRYHADTADEDARRVHGLGLPWVRRNMAAVLRPDFLEDLWREVHDRFLRRVHQGLLLPESRGA